VAVIVQVSNMTIRERLLEFGQTSAGSLTLEEFERESLLIECNKLNPETMDPPAFRRNKINEAFEAIIRNMQDNGAYTPFNAKKTKSASKEASSSKEGSTFLATIPTHASDGLDSEQKGALDKKLRDFHKYGRQREQKRRMYSFIEKTMMDDADASATAKSDLKSNMKMEANKQPLEAEGDDRTSIENSSAAPDKELPSGDSSAEKAKENEHKTDPSLDRESAATDIPKQEDENTTTTTNSTPSVTENAQSLSDVDDDELDDVFLNDSEVEKKTSIWMGMHSEYLRAKEEKRKIDEVMGKNNPLKGTKKKQKRNAGEEVKKHMEQRRISTKLNYSALAMLSGQPEADSKNSLRRSSGGSRKVMSGSRIQAKKAKEAHSHTSQGLPSTGALSKSIIENEQAKSAERSKNLPVALKAETTESEKSAEDASTVEKNTVAVEKKKKISQQLEKLREEEIIETELEVVVEKHEEGKEVGESGTNENNASANPDGEEDDEYDEDQDEGMALGEDYGDEGDYYDDGDEDDYY